MYFNMKVLLAGFLLLAVFYQIQADHEILQCWHCSSDTIGAEDFCGVDFNEDNIPTDELGKRNITVLRFCNNTVNSDQERPVCRKTVEEVNGKTITKRFCYYTNKSQHLSYCQQENTDKNVQRVFCEDCLKGKCNGASQLAGVFGIILLPSIVLAKTVVF